MKRILLSILMVLLLVIPALATDYYAQTSAQNINTASLWNTNPAGGGTDLVWANIQAGDNLYANGKTAIAINVSFNIGTGKISTEAGAGTAGGDFITVNATAITVVANIVSGTTTCFAPVASTGIITWTGNITGGVAANARGVYLNTSDNTLNLTGNVTGGSAISAYGIQNNQASIVAVTGNVTGGSYSPSSWGLYNSGTGTSSITGSAIGGSAAGADGARSVGSGAITITGFMANTATSVGASGRIVYSPDDATKFITFGATKYPAQLTAGNVKKDVVHGDVTGTFAGEGASGF